MKGTRMIVYEFLLELCMREWYLSQNQQAQMICVVLKLFSVVFHAHIECTQLIFISSVEENSYSETQVLFFS